LVLQVCDANRLNWLKKKFLNDLKKAELVAYIFQIFQMRVLNGVNQVIMKLFDNITLFLQNLEYIIQGSLAFSNFET
jgi:hypothetical protein